jgi:hypothetical protein
LQNVPTAPKTILEAAMQTVQQLFADTTAATTGAFHDGSAERMHLALDHLRGLLPQATPPPSREARIEDLIDAYAAPGLHPGKERIARAIARWGYRRGYCYASQEKIGRWAGLSKSTTQRLILEMEAEGFLQRTRREGTSSVIILAGGTLDALRLKKMRGITTRERTNPDVPRYFSPPPDVIPYETELSAPEKSRFGSKNTTCSLTHTTSISNDIDISLSSRVRAQEPVENSISTVFNDKKPQKNDEEKPKQRLVQKREDHHHTTSQNGKEEKKTPTPPTIPTRLAPAASRRVAAQTLIAEGVSHPRAHAFSRLFDLDGITRTIALDLHRDKNNPPAYLLRLLQDNTAARHPVPGSEAERVRQRERPQSPLRGRFAPSGGRGAPEQRRSSVSPAPRSPSVSGVVCGTFSGVPESPGEVTDPLQALPPEEHAAYTQRAREDVLRANPWLGPQAHQNTGPLMQAMIRRQLRAMLAAGVPPPAVHRQLRS